jgi:hypothetical protein
MSTSVLSARETSTAQTSSHVLELDELARALTNDALAHARAKLSSRDRGLDAASLLGRPNFVASLKAELASGIAHALAENDRRVRAVYTYDPALNADSEDGVGLPQDLTLHLIVWVESSSAALEAFIGALDRALIEGLQELSSPLFAQRSSWINPTIITDREVRLGLGAAGMLSAVFAPPIKVWDREAQA